MNRNSAGFGRRLSLMSLTIFCPVLPSNSKRRVSERGCR